MAEKKEPSEADQAYTHAVEAINRIIRELDEILKGSKYDGKADTDAGADR